MNGEDIFFKLNQEFLDSYKGKQPNWGFGGLGYVVYKRTYSRKLADGKSEEYWQTLKRVVEGVFTIQKRHCVNNKLPWNGRKANNSAQRMYELMWEFKFTPPGRGLWVMGTEKMWDIGSACLQNCAYHSTENITVDFAEPFSFLMDMSMLGVGVGGDVKGAGKITIRQPKLTDEPFVVPDTREGWVDLLRVLLNAYVGKNDLPKEVDYSLVRPKGAIIKGFGGIASGPQPLIDMYASIKEILDNRIGEKITSSDIVDIFNLVGKCVVSGGVRRTAEIMFGDYDDDEFLQLKNPEINKDKLYSHRWASNNSVYAKVGMDYSKVAKMTATNGEPGYVWLDTAKKFSRLKDVIDNKDYRISGTNPCFTGDTIVAVADGRNGVTIKQLAEESNGKLRFPVYSGKDTKYANQFGESDKFSHWKLQVKDAVAFKSGEKEIIEVFLSDGSSFRCTPDHELATKDGRWIEAQYTEGEQLQNFYTHSNKNTKKSYRHICSISNGYAKQYRLMWEYFNGEYDTSKYQINHVDSDSTNDSMENLQLMDITEHTDLTKKYGQDNNIHKCDKEYHRLYSKRSSIIANATRYNWSDQRTNAALQEFDDKYSELLYREDNNVYMNKPLVVENIVWLNEVEEVYDLTVDDNHNFYIITNTDDDKFLNCSGVLVSNCGEQGLESGELCNLVETYMSNHNTLEEWIETLKYAYLYAKTVTLLPTHRPLSNTIMNRNRRIGTSISGITQAFTKFGRRQVLNSMDDGYVKIQEWDKTYSDWLGIPRSIKTTTVKPSGSVSLLAGVTPGVHYPLAEYYIRNIRFQDDDKLLEKLINSGYKHEKDKYSLNTVVVSFPVKVDNFDRGVSDVSMWEQLEIVAQIQKYWSDNLVSATVTFNKDEATQIEYALQLYEDRLKGVSLLPILDHGYEQAPYIAITEEQYEDLNKDIKRLNKISVYEHESDDKFCTTDYCEVKTEKDNLENR